MAKKVGFYFRLDPAIMARVDAYAKKADWVRTQEGKRGGIKSNDIGRTALVEQLLEALVDGRVVVLDRPASGFPVEEIERGSSREHPAFVAFQDSTPQGEEP